MHGHEVALALALLGAHSPQSPASSYAAMDAAACTAELVRRQISYAPVTVARGVAQPIRLTSRLSGVRFRTDLGRDADGQTPYDILDCRLALALDDFSVILKRYGIVEVRHYSMYRPPGRSFPASKIAARHPGGLAIDAARFIRADGVALDVERGFSGRIGSDACGPKAYVGKIDLESIVLRHLVCEASEAQLFHVMLTPNYNWAHRNHFHLEVTKGARWFLLH